MTKSTSNVRFSGRVMLVTLLADLVIISPASATDAIPAQVVAQKEIDGLNVRAQAEIQNFEFRPTAVRIAPGTTVVWLNRDPVEHDVMVLATESASLSENVKSPLVARGERIAITFNRPGTYGYNCSVHPFMHGTITVSAGR